MSVVTFQAMQLRGVSNAATLSWRGHGFGPRCAQLLTLNPKLNPFISMHLNRAGVQTLNPTTTTHYHTTGGKDEKN